MNRNTVSPGYIKTFPICVTLAFSKLKDLMDGPGLQRAGLLFDGLRCTMDEPANHCGQIVPRTFIPFGHSLAVKHRSILIGRKSWRYKLQRILVFIL